MTKQLAPFRGHTRSCQWERVSYGLYAPATTRTLVEELQTWQLVLPRTAAFSHLTAAEVYGWWLPAPIPHPIFAAMTTTSHGPERPGLYVCRHPKPVAIRIASGLHLTTPAETLLAAARDLGILDLVVMADSALRLGHCTMTDLQTTARQHRRGAPLLRTAIPMLDPRSESPWESIMRVLHRAADIPVTVQYEVHDDVGRLLARADLRIDGTRRLQEYDGADHREAHVHARDLARDRRLLSDNWQRHGYVAKDVLHDGAQIIADVDRTLGRTWDSRRATAWQELVAHSLYGRPGRARAHKQWRRATF